MFTGIIEQLGVVESLDKNGTNLDLWIKSDVTSELKVDQSVAHNGVCLTVVDIVNDKYRVTAVEETLKKTCIGDLNVGDEVNLERALKVGDRLDGHFVQGHVDTTGQCVKKEELSGSWIFRFKYPEEYAAHFIEKGSVCINGVSLTVFDISNSEFSVTIIPYTFNNTAFKSLKENDTVNLELDVLGKYLLRKLSL